MTNFASSATSSRDRTGAIASRLAVGEGFPTLVAPTILTGLVVASWAVRPPTRRL
jgi:hypothetical protein